MTSKSHERKLSKRLKEVEECLKIIEFRECKRRAEIFNEECRLAKEREEIRNQQLIEEREEFERQRIEKLLHPEIEEQRIKMEIERKNHLLEIIHNAKKVEVKI